MVFVILYAALLVPTAKPAGDRRLLPIVEAAFLLGVGRTKLIGLINDGVIETVRVGPKRRLVPVEEIDRYVARLPCRARHRQGRERVSGRAKKPGHPMG